MRRVCREGVNDTSSIARTGSRCEDVEGKVVEGRREKQALFWGERGSRP